MSIKRKGGKPKFKKCPTGWPFTLTQKCATMYSVHFMVLVPAGHEHQDSCAMAFPSSTICSYSPNVLPDSSPRMGRLKSSHQIFYSDCEKKQPEWAQWRLDETLKPSSKLRLPDWSSLSLDANSPLSLIRKSPRPRTPCNIAFQTVFFCQFSYLLSAAPLRKQAFEFPFKVTLITSSSIQIGGICESHEAELAVQETQEPPTMLSNP